jgi:hypothetical protein
LDKCRRTHQAEFGLLLRSTTADGIACKLAYFLTVEGRRWMRARLRIDTAWGFADGVLDPGNAARQAEAIEELAEMRRKLIEFPSQMCKEVDPALVGRDFDEFVETDPRQFWPPGRDQTAQWLDVKKLAAGGRGAFSIDFAYVASILLQLSCSEGAAERLSSITKRALRADSLSMHTILLRAPILIRMNDQYGVLPSL